MNIDRYLARELAGKKGPLRWVAYFMIVLWVFAVVAVAGG